MFERKNQTLEHYRKLVDHEGDALLAGGSDDGGSDDEFITLKRADHELDEHLAAEPPETHISKRKIKVGKSKKAMLKYKGAGKKLIFDDEGIGHSIYQTQKPEEDVEKVKSAGREFAEVERSKLKEVDAEDKVLAKEKKREKKRKRRERERVSCSVSRGVWLIVHRQEEQGVAPAVASSLGRDEDNGYTSPNFDLPLSEDEDDRPRKRGRKELPPTGKVVIQRTADTLGDDEALALAMLQKRR
jgi:ATP-dependent RNA helicase DDX10/DBP4